MKVLIVVTQGVWGGAQRHVYDLAVGLKDRHSVTVMHGVGTELPLKLKEQSIQTIPLNSLKRSIGFSDVDTFFHLFKYALKERPDVMHAHSSKAAFLVRIVCFLTGIKTVITIHGLSFTQKHSPLFLFLFYANHALTCLMAGNIIAVSRYIHKRTPLRWLVEKKLNLVYNGIDCDTSIKKSLPTQISQPHIIGAIGELHETKGFDILIRAYARLPEEVQRETALVIVGEGSERNSLESLIEELGVQENVHLLGFIQDAHTLIHNFTVFALPSRSEALGYVLLEAGCVQVAALGSNVGGIPEVTDLLVESENVDELSRALSKTLRDKDFRDTAAQRLHTKVINSFSLESMLRKTEGVYTRLIPHPRIRA
jgi:glycosyltransferase involved in cell wall biosynthesis